MKLFACTQCGNHRNLLSHFFDKNFVKAMFLPKELLKSCFHEIFSVRELFDFTHCVISRTFFYFSAFPLICGHFDKITNEFCPEEKIHIRERSLSVVNLFLDEMSKEAKNIITTICDEQVN